MIQENIKENPEIVQVEPKIYSITEDNMTRWEKGELIFKIGEDRVNPTVVGRMSDGFNISFYHSKT